MEFIKINKNGYLTFYDKKRQKTVNICKSSGIKDADYKSYSDFSKIYYLQNKDILPKRIAYNKINKLFYVAWKFKDKNYSLGSFHTLEEAEQRFLEFKIFLIT